MQAVKQFAKEVEIPDAIIADYERENIKHGFQKFCNDIDTTLCILEENTPWANKAKLYIRLVKEAVRCDMKDSNCPLAFWDYYVEHRDKINNLMAKDIFSFHGTNPHTDTLGKEGDISSLCQFGWYEWCYLLNHREKFPFSRYILGQVLGLA